MKVFVREKRQEKGMTQALLAEQCGVSRQTIIAIESGRYIASTLLALKLAKMLEASVEELYLLEAGD